MYLAKASAAKKKREKFNISWMKKNAGVHRCREGEKTNV